MGRPGTSVNLWEVTVAAHSISGPHRTYEISEGRVTTGGEEGSARLCVLRWAHRDAGVPPWRPYMRKSWTHVTAKRAQVNPLDPFDAPHEQS